jgi:hypothetical protein
MIGVLIAVALALVGLCARAISAGRRRRTGGSGGREGAASLDAGGGTVSERGKFQLPLSSVIYPSYSSFSIAAAAAFRNALSTTRVMNSAEDPSNFLQIATNRPWV